MSCPVNEMFSKKKVFKNLWIPFLLVLLPAVYPIGSAIYRQDYNEMMNYLQVILLIDMGFVLGVLYVRKTLKGNKV